MQLKIRKVTKDDSKPLLELLEEARKYKLSLGDDAWGDYPFTQEDIDLRLKSDACYVAEVDGELVGSITLLWKDEHNWGQKGLDNQAGYIHGLMVSNEYRGKGLGKQMIDWAIDQVKQHKRSFIRLDCRANNKNLCTYYEDLGFTLIEVKNGTAFYQRAI